MKDDEADLLGDATTETDNAEVAAVEAFAGKRSAEMMMSGTAERKD